MGIISQHTTVAAREYDRKAGIALANKNSEVDATHPGHDDIGKYQIEGKLIFRKRGKCILSGGDPSDCVTKILKQFRGEPSDVLIVLHDQNTMTTATRRRLQSRCIHFRIGRGVFCSR